MVQDDILKLLKREKRPLSRMQIANALKEDPIKISHALRQMMTYKDIKCIELKREQAVEYLNDKSIKRRLRIYYC